MVWLLLLVSASAADVRIGNTTTTAIVGGAGGGSDTSGCTGTELAMGIAAEWGTLYAEPAVWRLTLRCDSPDVAAAQLVAGGSSAGGDRMGSQGNANQLGQDTVDCPTNTWLVGATVHTDLYVTAIEPWCAPLAWSGGQLVAGAPSVQPMVGIGGGVSTDLLCGPSEAVVGLEARAGWVVDAVGLVCAALEEGPAVCGDGAVDAGEDCDDANAMAGDGCTGCATDDGWTCVGDPSVCTPVDTGPPDTATTTDTGTTAPGTPTPGTTTDTGTTNPGTTNRGGTTDTGPTLPGTTTPGTTTPGTTDTDGTTGPTAGTTTTPSDGATGGVATEGCACDSPSLPTLRPWGLLARRHQPSGSTATSSASSPAFPRASVRP